MNQVTENQKLANYSLKGEFLVLSEQSTPWQKCCFVKTFHMFEREEKQGVSEGGANTWLGVLSLALETYQTTQKGGFPQPAVVAHTQCSRVSKICKGQTFVIF